jgi:bifunctional non-homologous end joining protein LigD
MEKLTKAKFTNLNKILYPELGITKFDIIKYYISVAPRILPFLKSRALVRTRYPDGIDQESFYEKDAPKGKPDWVETFTKYSKTSEKYTDYIVCNDLDTLIYLANLAAIELHIPLSVVPETDIPDMILFDLDPEPPAGLEETVTAAFLIKKKLDELDYVSYVKTSGKKGLHLLVPIEPKYDFEDTKGYVREIGAEISEESEFIVYERSKTKDPGTVLIDYPQNSERATIIAPYSLRAVKEITYSAPIEWSELSSIRLFDYNIFSIEYRNKQPWKDFFKKRKSLHLKGNAI